MDEPQGGANPGAVHGRPNAGDEIDLLEYWRVLVERRRVVLGCVVATVAAALLVTLLTTPQYRAATTLQIERQGPDVLTFKDVMGVDPMGYKDFYQTQYKILQSRSVLTIAARDLDLANDPEFLSRKGTPLGRMIRWARETVAGAEPDDDPHERAVNFLEDGVGVAPVRNSHLVTVSFLDREPAFAARIANAVADAYQRFNLQNRSTTTQVASESLAEEIVRQSDEVDKLERQLQELTANLGLVQMSDGADDIHERRLAVLNDDLSAALSRRSTAEARYRTVADEPADSLPEVLNSALIQRLRENYAELERRHAQMSDRFKPGWPELAELEQQLEQSRVRMDDEVSTIARQVRETARASFEQADEEVRNLSEQVDAAKLALQRAQTDAIELDRLRTSLAKSREVLDAMVGRQRETMSSGQLAKVGVGNIRVVDRAEPPEDAAKPRKALNLALALVLGLSLGVGVAFLQHHLDNTIQTDADVERHAPGVALLGHIPLFQELKVLDGGAEPKPPAPVNPDRASHDDPRSVFAEAFKNLRTSVLLASPDHAPRNLVVTSCEPADGKSTIAINLATVLSQMGRRVLLIDADLRKPRLHRTLSLDNAVGLSSYLSGNAEIHEIIQATPIDDLPAITSGPVPPNPSELLDSPRLDSLLAHAKDAGFDHVIFDCPPTLHVADGVILGTKADGTLLVVRAGATTRDALAQGTARLRQSRVRVVGAVLNAVSESGGYYYRYRYYRHDDGASRPKRAGLSVRLGRRRASGD